MRLIGPSARLVYTVPIAGPTRGLLKGKPGGTVTFYDDLDPTAEPTVSMLTSLADILDLGGNPIPDSAVMVSSLSTCPLVQFPDGVDTILMQADGGPPWRGYARTDDRMDALEEGLVTANTELINIGTDIDVLAASITSLGTTVGGKLAKASNLSDLPSPSTARANLGLGSASGLSLGTTTGTVAEGNAPAAAQTAAINAAALYTDSIPDRVPYGAIRIDPDLVTAAHAAAPLTTPTSEGSGQCVHPGMYYNPAGWGADTNGKSYRYWMAMTPYPGGLEAVENPEILASDDGITWVVPPGLTNPIDVPGSGFYPDPDLININGVLWCIYAGNKAKYSSNGITWSAQQVLGNIGGSGTVCPTIQRVDGVFWVWTVYKTVDSSPYVLRLQKSTPILGPYSAVINCTFPVPTGKDIWHLNIRKVGDQFFAVAALCDKGTSGTNTELHFAVSDNGVVWKVSAKPILAPVPNTWTSQQIYQSAIVPLDGRDGRLFGLWYTGVQNPNIWRIGYTEIVSARDRQGVALTATPNTLSAGQVNRADARNRLANPSLLVAASGAIVPTGYSNNLISFSGHAWEEATEAYTALKATAGGGGNLQLVHTEAFVEGDTWCASVEWKASGYDDGSAGISIQWLTAADATIGAAIVGPGSPNKSTSFKRLYVVGVVPATAAKIRISYTIAVTNPVQFWWRRAQLEKAAAPSTYMPNSAVVKRAVSGQVGNLEEWQTLLAAGAGGGARVGMAMTKDGRLKSGLVNEQTTVGATGAATALPAQPLKYIRVELDDGTQGVVPVYRQA